MAAIEEPSHVLTAMGLKRNEAMSSLRFSLGNENILLNTENINSILNIN
jgi:cysteine sulfinate desulfinase/cysteine desulfurase-like protein